MYAYGLKTKDFGLNSLFPQGPNQAAENLRGFLTFDLYLPEFFRGQISKPLRQRYLILRLAGGAIGHVKKMQKVALGIPSAPLHDI